MSIRSIQLFLYSCLIFTFLSSGCNVDPTKEGPVKEWSKAHWARRAGVKPPPPGYEYWRRGGNIALDSDGNPVLYKENGFTIQIQLSIGYAPTLEQHKRVSLLEAERNKKYILDDSVAVKHLDIEIAHLKHQVKGELPAIQMPDIIVGTPTKEWWEKHDKVYRQARETVYKAFSLQHIIPPPIVEDTNPQQ